MRKAHFCFPKFVKHRLRSKRTGKCEAVSWHKINKGVGEIPNAFIFAKLTLRSGSMKKVK